MAHRAEKPAREKKGRMYERLSGRITAGPVRPQRDPGETPPDSFARVRTAWRSFLRMGGGWALPVTVALLLLAVCVVDGAAHRRVQAVTAHVLENAVAVKGEDFLETGIIELHGVAGLSEEFLRDNLYLRAGKRQYFTVKKEDTRADVAFLHHWGDVDNRTYELTLTLQQANRTLHWLVNEPTMTASLVKSSVVPGESVYIQFSEPVDPKSLRNNLRLTSGASTVSPKDYTLHPNGELVELRIKLTGGVLRYGIDLQEDLVSVDGNRLVERTYLDVAVRPRRTTVKRPFQVTLGGAGTEILQPDQPVTMEFSTDARYWPTEEATVTLYRFPHLDDYMETAAQYNLAEKKPLDPADTLEAVGSGAVTLETGESGISMENPGTGGYLLEAVYHNPLTDETGRVRKAVMVSDLSVYVQSVQGQTMAWVNSGSTGRPVAGHTVDFLDKKGETVLSAVTDADGVAIAEIPYDPYKDRDSSYQMRIRNSGGGTVYADKTAVLSWNYSGGYDRYYAYFYLDRAIYRPQDEINFWGYVEAYATNSTPQPRQVRVVLDPGGLDMEVTAQVDENHVFHGTLPIEKVKSSHYQVIAYVPFTGYEHQRDEDGNMERVYVERENTLDASYIQVKEYEKPLFIIAAENDKPFYNYDEDVTVTVTPKFYDGTPLPNYELEYTVYDSYYGRETLAGSVLTDDDGIAQLQFPAFQMSAEPFGWRPATNRYRIEIKSDGEDISYTGTYTYFPTNRMLSSLTSVSEDCVLTLGVSTNEMDISGLETADDLQAISQANYYYYEDTQSYYSEAYEGIVGAPVDTKVTAKLSLRFYTYDGKYQNKEKTVTLETVGGMAEQVLDIGELFGVEIDTGKSVWVYVDYILADPQGRQVQYSQSAYKASRSAGNYGYTEDDGPQVYRGYSFAVTNDAGESAIGDFLPYQPYDYVLFNEGENFHMSLHYNGVPAENKGRILYTVLQDKIIQRAFTTASELHFTEQVRYASNVNIVAAYFDGKDVHVIRDTVVGLASDSIRLNLEVTPDKAEYRPGETANIALKVTDENGRGVSGNAVISIVDEAIFALREQYIELLRDLYSQSYYYNYYVSKYTSGLRDVSRMGLGDGGKGDENSVTFDDSYRKNFRDTAVFRPVRTNAAGEAYIAFTLPDNITSWRVTALGISDKRFAGQTQANFVTTQPFFISPVLSSKYIEGDDVALQVRAYGSALSAGEQVDFTATLTGDNYSQTFTAQNAAFKASHVSFGQLPVGEYTLVASARWGQSRDTVELPVTVIPSNLELVVNRPLDLGQPVSVNALRYPVTMSFYSADHEPYFRTVGSLLKHYCNIANQRMSRYVAKRALMSYMDEADVPRYLLDGTDSVSDMQNSDGGVGWSQDSKSEPVLTAKVLLLAPDQFNVNSMKGYFRSVVEQYGADLLEEGNRPKTTQKSNRTYVTAAYLGLAALGEPVADEIRSLMELPGTTLEHQAHLVAALAYTGDTAGARREYDRLIAPNLDSRVDGISIRRADKQYWRDDQATAAVWMAAVRLGLADADEIARYFGAKSWRIDSLFEAMYYVDNYSKTVRPLSFQYEMNGAVHTMNLGTAGRKTMKLNQSAMESFRIVSVPDDLAATAYYIGEPSEADLEPSDNIAISKDITRVDERRYRVKLTLQFGDEAATGQYDISDWVPSNMRMYKLGSGNRSGSQKNWYYTSTAEGQKLYFRVMRDSAAVKTATITYTVQEVFEAAAMVDSTYVIHGNSGDSGLTERYRWDPAAIPAGD